MGLWRRRYEERVLLKEVLASGGGLTGIGIRSVEKNGSGWTVGKWNLAVAVVVNRSGGGVAGSVVQWWLL